MAGKKSAAAAALGVALLVGWVSPAAAGPIAVFTGVWQTSAGTNDEIPVSGLGDWARLTTGGGVSPVVTVPADQTTARQAVVGFWPVMSFSDPAQYQAQRDKVVTIPDTSVTLYAEVWNGAYGQARDVQTVQVNAVVSGQISPAAGQNEIDWRFVDPPTQVHFGDTVVTLSYTPVRMPDGTPQIQFADGSPSIGFPGPIYYPTLLEANVDVSRPPTDPGDPGVPPGAAPEPSSVLLLAGLTLGGLFTRRYAGKPVWLTAPSRRIART